MSPHAAVVRRLLSSPQQRMKNLPCGVVALVLAIASPLLPQSAATAAPTAHEATLAVSWVQQSAEFRALCAQTFNAGRLMLPRALDDFQWSAALEQATVTGFGNLPPAIIVDVDETVLDNSPYQARLIATGQSFARPSWNEWANQAAAEPLAGAVPFLQHAAQQGVTIFYVTNRSSDLEPATRRNLIACGFPVIDEEIMDVVLTLGERDETSSDKSPRRRIVAESHRVLMIFGDDLGDFLSAIKPTSSAATSTAAEIRSEADDLARGRAARSAEFDAWWGTRWFMLPNPSYGSWLSVLEAQSMHVVERDGRQFLVPALREKLVTREPPATTASDK